VCTYLQIAKNTCDNIYNEKQCKYCSLLFVCLLIQVNSITDTVEVEVSIGDSTFLVHARASETFLEFPLNINGQSITFKLPPWKVKEGCTLFLSHIGITVTVKEVLVKKDDLNSYVKNFMQWYFVIIQLKDTIHEGDIERTNIILKMMIPFFYSHSTLSKYFVECVDFILKTEHLLTPQLALRVRAGSFVNPNGGAGKNKAADIQKENEVKMLKELIKGLGANKTEKSIIQISKAAPVISQVVDNFDQMTGIQNVKSTHKVLSRSEDIKVLLEKLQKLQLWKLKHGRFLSGFPDVAKSPFNFDVTKMKSQIMATAERLRLDIPDVSEISDDETDENP
jgi:hypothetical protein